MIKKIAISILAGTALALFATTIIIAQGVIEPESAVEESENTSYLQQNITGKMVEADILQKRVLDYYEEKYGVSSPETLKFVEALAWMNMELQDYREASTYYLRAIDIREHNMPQNADNSKELAVAYFMLADANLYMEYFLEAESYYEKSLGLAIDPAHQGDVFSRKGIIYDALKKYDQSIKFYLDAARKYDMARNRNPQNRQVINKRLLLVYTALVELYGEVDNPDKVKEYEALRMVTERLLTN